MNWGIVQVVFGEGYSKMAMHCAKLSMRNTSLPLHILTNVPVARLQEWGLPRTTFRFFDLPTSENREIKTRMNEFTPFEKTLYFDCDVVLQRKGLHFAFHLLDDFDMVLHRQYRWGVGDKVLHVYKRAMKRFGVKPPVDVWHGGVMGFKKNGRTTAFFKTWNRFWKEFGKAREMPPLTCAADRVRRGGLSIGILPPLFFEADGLRPKAVLQHNTGKTFIKKFGIQPYEKLYPKTGRGDFSFEDWD